MLSFDFGFHNDSLGSANYRESKYKIRIYILRLKNKKEIEGPVLPAAPAAATTTAAATATATPAPSWETEAEAEAAEATKAETSVEAEAAATPEGLCLVSYYEGSCCEHRYYCCNCYSTNGVLKIICYFLFQILGYYHLFYVLWPMDGHEKE